MQTSITDGTVTVTLTREEARTLCNEAVTAYLNLDLSEEGLRSLAQQLDSVETATPPEHYDAVQFRHKSAEAAIWIPIPDDHRLWYIGALHLAAGDVHHIVRVDKTGALDYFPADTWDVRKDLR